MSNSHTIRNLTTLVGLRSTEVERLQTEMAAQTAVRDRYQKNLERLTSLYTDSGPAAPCTWRCRSTAATSSNR